jgi:hypothetical protein
MWLLYDLNKFHSYPYVLFEIYEGICAKDSVSNVRQGVHQLAPLRRLDVHSLIELRLLDHLPCHSW